MELIEIWEHPTARYPPAWRVTQNSSKAKYNRSLNRMRHSVRELLAVSIAFSLVSQREAQYHRMLFDRLGHRKYLTSAEREAFINAARKFEPMVETFCHTIAYTGARISEVLATTPARIDASASIIVIECLKRRSNGVFRAVPVPDDLLARLEAVHSITAAQYDAVRRDERIWRWGRTTAWQRVKDVMAEGDVPRAWAMPKALRHAFGVQGTAEAGVPLNIMQKWMGHARIETTAIYANAVGREERKLAERMWKI
jgi:integrase